MIIGKDLASGLRKLKEKDIIEINGEEYVVLGLDFGECMGCRDFKSFEENIVSGDLRKEHEILEKGMEIELRKAGAGPPPHYLLSLMDIEIEYGRIEVIDGPLPPGYVPRPNSDTIFLHDAKAKKTHKYSRNKRWKDKIKLRLFKGIEREEEIDIESIHIKSSFDTFVAETTCPSCDKKAVFEFQSKQFRCLKNRYKVGSLFEEGGRKEAYYAQSAYTYCINCGKCFWVDIIIKDKKFVGVASPTEENEYD